jgi:hypothetical protein
MYTLENEWEEETISNQKIDPKTPQNQNSLENERPGCPVSKRKFGRGFIKGSWEAILPCYGQIEL